jgi:hypothetical protein
VLALIFWAWYRSEGTLSIHSIVTRRREAFYWAVVFATFALGTALGDFTASVLGLGYLASAIMFVFIILIPAVSGGGSGSTRSPPSGSPTWSPVRWAPRSPTTSAGPGR